jgi:hypothetical protein
MLRVTAVVKTAKLPISGGGFISGHGHFKRPVYQPHSDCFVAFRPIANPLGQVLISQQTAD